MSTLKKHVGRIRNTDRRCVVVYMEVPGNEENALIVDTDALPDRFHDALMDIIDSKEGQQTLHLHTLLSRRILPDLGLDMMNALHTYGQLRSVPIDNIVMYPAPSSPVALRTIVDYNRAQVAPPEEKVVLENRILENQKVDSSEAQLDIARNILQQAQDLESEAARKREQAYRLSPTLRPQVTDSPEVIEASVPAADVSHGPSESQPTTALAEDVWDTEGPAPVAEADEEPSYQIANEVDLSHLPDDVKMALHAAVAQANVSAQGYNIVEGDTPEAPAAPEYNLVETDAPEAPAAPEYDFVGGEELPPMGATPYVAPEPTEDADDLGNQVDTSDEAVQAFLDRVAQREDLADKELQESLKPKAPVGRPRKDGLPAGTKTGEISAPEPAPKKRGRPPKAKL